jgi:Domain of Unknown Function with PDB structure (DUF3857)
MKRVLNFLLLRPLCGLILLFGLFAWPAHSQEAASSTTKQAAKAPEASGKQPELPAQIELLETRVRFEANGDSRKEVHTRVRINNELGARQFARLTFDYNRSFQQIEFPLVRITHEGGGTVDILPSAIADQPNPAVVNAPAYQDVRVKSVRTLGLGPGDILEYRTVTTASSRPLYISHDIARDNLVAREVFEVDLSAASKAAPITSRFAETYTTKESDEGTEPRVLYQWRWPSASETENKHAVAGKIDVPSPPNATPQSDIVLTTLQWNDFLGPLRDALSKFDPTPSRVKSEAQSLTRSAATQEAGLEMLYDFVSQKIRTVDLPVGATGFRLREPGDILSSGYGVPEDKSLLLSTMAASIGIEAAPALILSSKSAISRGANPSALANILNIARFEGHAVWLDPSVEVAPFGMVRPELRAKPALLVSPPNDVQFFEKVSADPSFAATQRVNVDAAISSDGTLSGKVKYTMRGDNELLLRVAFHQAPKEKWKEVAQLLALSDGFRGKITNVTASDPYATKEPFTVEYEIVQPKFVDWSKKPVRIPALLPQLGLPDSSAKPGSGAGTSAIDLGTPLDVETHLTLHLPAGTSARTPAGTSVERDYATFASKYAANGATVTATRHLNFLLREVQGDRAADYNAFVRAVQGDEAQEFTLERGETVAQPKSDVPPAKEN